MLLCERLPHVSALSRPWPPRHVHSAGEEAHPDNGDPCTADGKAADYPGGRSINRSRLKRTQAKQLSYDEAIPTRMHFNNWCRVESTCEPTERADEQDQQQKAEPRPVSDHVALSFHRYWFQSTAP